MSKYECGICEYTTNYLSWWNKHLQTKKHKRLTTPPQLKKCNMCSYKSYDQKNLYAHKQRHKTKDKKKIVKLKKKDEYYDDIEVIKKKINKILTHCKENNINPNEYFNYKYYVYNINNMNVVDYNHFYQEIKHLMNVNKSNHL